MTRDAQFARGRIHIVPATSADADACAQAGRPGRAFLRGIWAEAASPGQVQRLAAIRADGTPIAVLPFVSRELGPVPLREVAGCYWPFRSVALAADAQPEELAAMFGAPELKRALGKVWRLGPVHEDDAAVGALRQAAGAAGWAVLTRRLGTCFEIDVATLAAQGPWPRPATLRKNRWREKRLGEGGAVEIEWFTGAGWTAAQRDAVAQIERNSWLGKLGAKAAMQFADSGQRLYWERVAADPELAAMLFGSVLTIGGVPAAFTFGLQVGTTRYYIANNYDERFAQHSVGRTLLLKDFERAAASGIRRISWGSGDAGYKSEMGAQAGPAILDLLFVRPRLLAWPLRRLWSR